MAREIADATYESVPPQSMWNPLEDVMKEELNFDGTPAIETASTQPALEAPAPVSASEVSGAELTEPAATESAPESAMETAHIGIEGTVPRGSAPEEIPTTT
jgi:hypothetical protein